LNERERTRSMLTPFTPAHFGLLPATSHFVRSSHSFPRNSAQVPVVPFFLYENRSLSFGVFPMGSRSESIKKDEIKVTKKTT
jgi:hypothetical protein